MAALRSTLTWTHRPLIINAPMGGFAGSALASAVSKAGGLGMIGAVNSMPELRQNLSEAKENLSAQTTGKVLPVGVGLLPFVTPMKEAIPILAEFNPAVVWLFAAKTLDDYAVWGAEIRKECPDSQIWIQCGSVASALHIAKTCQPDVLALQGADAGGHGFEKGAGIISLFPEVADVLAREGFGGIKLVAAGGIADGRGVAAALALGADGVVLGTRFLAAKETVLHEAYREAVVNASDGGQVTTRSKLFDELRGPNVWPQEYDGRSILMKSWEDYKGGVGIDDIRKAHAEAVKGANGGFGVDGRAAMWAGTGIGLVNEVMDGEAIVEELRKEAREALGTLSQM